MEFEAATRILLSPAAEQDDDDRINGPDSPPAQSSDEMISPIARKLIKLEPASPNGSHRGVVTEATVGATDNCDSEHDEYVESLRCTTGSEGRPLIDVEINSPTVTRIATATTMATTDQELLDNSVNDGDEDNDDAEQKDSESAESSSNKRHRNNNNHHHRPTRGQISSNHNSQNRQRHKRRQQWQENTTPVALATTTTVSEAQLDKLSSLIKIIRNGNYNEFSELLEGRAIENLLNVFVDGQTALHYTLIYGRSLAWCEQLVLRGAEPNLTNRAGWHPIHLAAFNGSVETMRYLINKCIAN